MSVAVKPDTSACRGNCPSFSPAAAIAGCRGQALISRPPGAIAPDVDSVAPNLSFSEKNAGPNPIQAPVNATASRTNKDAKIIRCRDFGASGLGGEMAEIGSSGPNSNSGKVRGNLMGGGAAAGCGGRTFAFSGSGKGADAGPGCFRAFATAAAPSNKPDTKTAPRRLLTAIFAPWCRKVMAKTACHASTQKPDKGNRLTRPQQPFQRPGQLGRRIGRGESASRNAQCVS